MRRAVRILAALGENATRTVHRAFVVDGDVAGCEVGGLDPVARPVDRGDQRVVLVAIAEQRPVRAQRRFSPPSSPDPVQKKKK